ncbi:DUF222 domain-containing protein [Nocardioides sp. C4-1]|uniref:DUF222 domain-containing protein n=1 Tax=Nocardioides sp. C4-1 TaxID=3151851 RepID=UPI0032660C1F
MTFVHATRVRAATLADVDLDSLDAAATESLVASVAALENQVAELKARAVGRARDLGLPRASGTRSTAVWLARHTRIEPAVARRTTRLADSLRARPDLRHAMCVGAVNLDQAVAIRASLRTFERASIDPAVVERHLVEQASLCNVGALRDLARQALDDADPAGAAARRAAEHHARQHRATGTTRLSMYDDDGRTHGRFILPVEKGHQLRAALESLVEPGRAATDTEAQRTPDAESLGRAFVQLLEGSIRSRRVSDLLDAPRRLRDRRRRPAPAA